MFIQCPPPSLSWSDVSVHASILMLYNKFNSHKAGLYQFPTKQNRESFAVIAVNGYNYYEEFVYLVPIADIAVNNYTCFLI